MWKNNLEETKKHYINWWNHKGVVVNMWEHFQEGVAPHGPYSSEAPIRLTEALRNDFGTGAFGLPGAPKATDNHQKWFDPQWRAEYLDWYVGHSCLKADMLPVANTQLGPGSLAAILGARFEGGEDTIWIHPDPDFTDDFVFNPDSANYRIHKELLKACKARANGNYYVGMPDLMEGLDVLAAMKGTDKVLLDTVMQPEVVERQLKYINEVYFKVFDELYEIIREGDEMAFCYFSSWAPGKMTKLQCDISTMISEDDYRRFVQPFLREQCQKIPYTLYHLDGVGALHHLPAILEIEELKAVQWTPGVGEPQGGDPKWYDLYRKILSAGKSIMACWVTLDQLRPLLDNIGGDGIHLEMDFKNEDEVEQALRIVEEYQSAAVEKTVDEAIHVSDSLTFSSKTAPRYKNIRGVKTAEEVVSERSKATGNDSQNTVNGVSIPSVPVTITPSRPSLEELSEKRVLILDGGMGTMVQQYGMKGCSDELNITRPEVISDIHRRYLTAGADIITTNTFSSQAVSLADYGWQERVREFNLSAARIARQVADAFTFTNPEKPRYVAGSVGPTNKCVSFGTAGCAPLGTEVLQKAYAEQIEALLDGGVDILLIETIFDLENAYYALRAAEDVMSSRGVRLPIMLSFAQVNVSGMNMNGQDVFTFIEKNTRKFEIFSVGVNCTSEPAVIADVVMEMAQRFSCRISIYGNAGIPDAHGRYLQTPESFARQNWRLIDAHAVNVVGGCCGTTDSHIAALTSLVEPFENCFVTPKKGACNGDISSVNAEKTVASQTDSAKANDVNTDASAEVSVSDTAASATTTSKTPATSEPSILDAIVAGKEADAIKATEAAVAIGADPSELINTQMIQAMSVVGQRFQEGKAFVPQLLMAGRAMKAALGILKPIMEANGGGMESAGKIVIGTVKGDLHDIGKNLVASMLEGSGFEVVNIGIDVDAQAFVDAVKENNADILCLSALLTTTMTYMSDVLEALKVAGLRDKVKVMVGGAPVSKEFAVEIGADGYSSNANEAVALAKSLMEKK